MTLFKKQQHAMKKTFNKREAVYVFSRMILHGCRYTVNILMAITTADSGSVVIRHAALRVCAILDLSSFLFDRPLWCRKHLV